MSRNFGILETGSVHGDEYYTRRADVEKIADWLVVKPNQRIWCPFDTDESNFPIVLRERGYDVVNTSTDFFTTPPPAGVSCIISNPPFSLKKQVLERIDSLGLQFALILPLVWLNDGVPFDYGNQLIMFKKRMKFDHMELGPMNKPRSNCVVLSNGLLLKDLIIDRR